MTDDEVCIENLLAHRPWLEQLAHTLVRDPHAADDAVQNTWVSALRRRPDRSARARAWLRTVLLHEVFQAIRKGRCRRRHEALASESADREEQPASELELDEQWAEIVHALDELDEPYRSTLRLHYLDELSSPEIAKRLGVPSATVRWRVKRGMARLRASCERLHRDGHDEGSARHLPSLSACAGSASELPRDLVDRLP